MTDRIDDLHDGLAEAREAADWHYEQARFHAAMYRRWQKATAQWESILPGLVEAEDVAAAAWGTE